MAAFGALLLISFKVMAALFVQYGVAAVVAYKGVIKESDMRAFSAVMNVVLIPLLSMVSLGRGLSSHIFSTDGWVLAVIGTAEFFEFAAMALVLRLLAKPTAEFRRVFVLAMCIANVVAVPLSVTQTLCQLGAFDDEFAEAGECVLRSRALVFSYVSFNSFNIWVVAYGYLANDPSAAAPTAPKLATVEKGAEVATPSGGQEVPATPPALGALADDARRPSDVDLESRDSRASISTTEAASSPPASPARLVGAARSTGSPARRSGRDPWISLARSTGSRASTANMLAAMPVPPGASSRSGALRLARQQLVSMAKRPPVIGLVLGFVIGLTPPLQSALFSEGASLEPIGRALAALSEGAVPVVNLMLGFSPGRLSKRPSSWRQSSAASPPASRHTTSQVLTAGSMLLPNSRGPDGPLGHKLKGLTSWRQLLGSAEAGISPRTMLTLALGRMLVLPACHGAMLYGFLDALPRSRLARVILFIEGAPPTASIVVVLAHVARKPRAAQLLAWAVVPQYLLAIVTLTLVITFALAVTEP